MRAVLVDSSNNILTAVELAADWQDPQSKNYWTPPDGATVVFHDTAGKGWTYDGTNCAAPPAVVPPALSARIQSLLADGNRSDLLTRLANADANAIDTWLTNNVTNLAQARVVLGAIIKYLAFTQ